MLIRNRRLRLSALHLACSAAVGLLVAALVLLVWYPWPLAAISGGLGLLALIMSVDVVLGPLLTAVAAAPGKPAAEFRRDLAVILALQLAGMGYGLYNIAMARPVHLSFEVDRIRVVSAADIDPVALAEAPPELRQLPWTGPRLIAATKPSDPSEQLRAMDLGLAGFDLSLVPKYWRSYESQREEVLRRARPVAELLKRSPQHEAEARKLAGSAGVPLDSVVTLPLQSRWASWTVLLARPDARLVGYLPLDSFGP